MARAQEVPGVAAPQTDPYTMAILARQGQGAESRLAQAMQETGASARTGASLQSNEVIQASQRASQEKMQAREMEARAADRDLSLQMQREDQGFKERSEKNSRDFYLGIARDDRAMMERAIDGYTDLEILKVKRDEERSTMMHQGLLKGLEINTLTDELRQSTMKKQIDSEDAEDRRLSLFQNRKEQILGDLKASPLGMPSVDRIKRDPELLATTLNGVFRSQGWPITWADIEKGDTSRLSQAMAEGKFDAVDYAALKNILSGAGGFLTDYLGEVRKQEMPPLLTDEDAKAAAGMWDKFMLKMRGRGPTQPLNWMTDYVTKPAQERVKAGQAERVAERGEKRFVEGALDNWIKNLMNTTLALDLIENNEIPVTNSPFTVGKLAQMGANLAQGRRTTYRYPADSLDPMGKVDFSRLYQDMQSRRDQIKNIEIPTGLSRQEKLKYLEAQLMKISGGGDTTMLEQMDAMIQQLRKKAGIAGMSEEGPPINTWGGAQ